MVPNLRRLAWQCLYTGPVNGPTQVYGSPMVQDLTLAHIVWDQPLRAGGIIGGDYGSLSYGAQGSGI